MSEYISRGAVINITTETGAWETQNRIENGMQYCPSYGAKMDGDANE